MKTFSYVVMDELGLHARPAGMIVKEGRSFTSALTISANGKTVELTRLLAVMSLGVKQGQEVTVIAEGEDEDLAIATMESLFQKNL